MCFVRIAGKIVTISISSIKWSLFIIKIECVYCAIRAESLNIIQFSASL